MKSTSIYLALLLLMLSCNAQNSEKLNPSDIETKVDAYVKQYTDLDIFSGVVLVAQDGAAVYHKPFGLADREKKIPVTLNTKFIIGSMNKSFTQVVVLQLIKEGKLKYSTRLTDILSGFTLPAATDITIEHLLNHRSGFGDYHGPLFRNLPYEQKNIQGITEVIKNMELNFPPGTEQEYSNAGYILLGAIIEKVTGKSFAANVKERISKRLDLKETYLENISIIPDRSIGYTKTITGYEDNLDFITEPRSDGGFWCTAADVLRFYRAFFYDEKLLDKETRESFEFFKAIKPLYKEKGKAIPLAGGMNGINTVHFEMLSEKISIVILANMDEPVAEKLGKGIKDIIVHKKPENAALPARMNVYKAYTEKGISYVKANFAELTSNFHPADPKDMILNNIGYELLKSKKTNDALSIFKLNTELFPDVANCWDSYGEALAMTGDKNAAIEAYKKALSIRPKLQSAIDALEKLQK